MAVMAVGFLAFATLSGCATKGYDKSQQAAWSLQVAGEEVQNERRALESALASLNDLVNKPPDDLITAYRQFGTQVDQLVAAERRNEAAARRVDRTSAAYFQSWDKELGDMSFDAIRERSLARKNEVANHFDLVKRRYTEAQSAMQPLIAYLQDIQKALSTDLTRAGLEAMKSAVENANANGGKVQTALNNLSSELSTSGVKLSSVAVQNGQ